MVPRQPWLLTWCLSRSANRRVAQCCVRRRTAGTGFKPTHDLLPMEGVLPLAKSLDTLGLYTHTPVDMLALWNAMGYPTGHEEQFAFGTSEPALECEPKMMSTFQKALSLLRRSGVSIEPVDISALLKKVDDASNVVTYYEGARFHEQRFKEYGNRLDQSLVELVVDGLKIPVERYDEAKRHISESRVRLSEIFKSSR